jgi:hypothetical protein
MGININIATKFDSAGVRSAKRELGTLKRDLSGSVSALGSNIAVLGAGIAGVTGYLAKTVNAASNFSAQFEGVNQTFGRGAKAVQDYAAQASQLSGISETAALNAAKNFGGFATSAGLSGQAAADFAIELVKAAGDLASFADVPVDEALNAIQSGLAGQTEPLRNFQILLDQTTLKNRAFDMGLTKTTDEALTPQQKVLATHVELLDQMGVKAGDFINYSGTYGNQIKSLTAEWSDMEVAIGQELLPVLEQLMPEIKDMAREFGTTLKNAVKAIDWKSLLTDLAGIATWFVNNAGRITQIATAFIVLSTAINAMRVMLDLGKISMAAFTYVQSQMAAGATIATIAVGALRAALITTGVGAVIVGLGLIANEFLFVKNETNAATGAVNDYKTATNGIRKETKTEIDNHNGDVNRLRASWSNATTVALSYRDAVTGAIVSNIPSSPTTGNASRTPDPLKPGFSYQVLQNGKWMNATWTGTKWNLEEMKYTPSTSGSTGAGKGTSGSTFQQSLTLGNKQAEAQGQLQGLKFSQGYIDGLLGSEGGLKQAKTLIKKATSLPIKKQTKFVEKENKKFAGTIGEVNRVAAENASLLAQQAAKEAADLVAAQEKAIADEAAAVAERERIYQSFADSVKNTFAGIKNSIMGAFDLTQLGGSTNSITRNMDKLLTRLRSFATNVKSLATMGLNPALLQQIISAGPMAGARLAEGLAMGGQAGLSAINAGYAEFGALSGQIAETGTQSLFGTGAQQSVYNINVDGGVGSGSTIGKAIVDAIKAYERTSGAVWQGA